MFRTRHTVAARIVALSSIGVIALAACGRSATDDSSSPTGTQSRSTAPTTDLKATTTPGTKKGGALVWAVYRDVQTLDPIYAFDYPDNTAITLMCESLLKISPQGQIGPGLATLKRTDPKTLVFDINPKTKFWDGSTVTAADVVYSLNRQTDAKLGGFYGATFSRVASISATGSEQVTIKLKQADYWLDGELASFAGEIVQKKYAERLGKKYGTPSGGIMCTGAYKLKSWKPADGVVAVPNTGYWDSSVKPKVSQITLKGASDEAAFTSAITTGAIGGAYPFGLSTLKQVEQSSAVTVTQGPGYSTDAFVVSSLKGVLGDVRVRQALSLALDRAGIIDSVHKGSALMPRWFSNPGTFGYAKSTFQAAYDKTPPMKQDLAKAKSLITAAKAQGKTLTIGMSSALANISAVAGAYQAAGKAIGLNVKLKSVSADNYINFFTDAKARAGIDAFLTVNYGDYADPAALLATLVLPDGSQNFSGFNDKEITDLMGQARGTADPVERAKLIIKVEQRVNTLLPWIPNAQPNTVLVLNKKFTGAVSSFAYMFAPWANQLGGS